jgi:hypothetical protein
VPSDSLEHLLERLEELKRPADARSLARLNQTLGQLGRLKFRDAGALIRLHESLLFMRAYPQSGAHLRRVERLLSSFKARVEELRETGADLYAFSEPDVSGVIGTSFSALFSYEVVRELARLHPGSISLDWEGYEEHERFAVILSKFLPLVEENAYVEPLYPFLKWLRAGLKPGETELGWLLERFEEWELPAEEKGVLFNSLKLWLRWEFRSPPESRTCMKRRVRKVFYHQGPLLKRGDISLARELEAGALPVEKLSRAEGQALLDAGRTTMAARYRELHGFTFGDAGSVVRAGAGRGVELFLWGVPAERRLPTLAYHAAVIFKNGVPHGYAEALSLFERAEVGLNLFYTFREGESAWIYARMLRLFRQLLGVSVFSIDPYQLGFHNEEGIASGAFWFYRKQGFRPTDPKLLKLVLSEEKRIAEREGYRTPARTLRRLAAGHVLYAHGAAAEGEAHGWDGFHMRNLGLAVARRMGERDNGQAKDVRSASMSTVGHALGIDALEFSADERRAFSDWALLLALIPDLARWTDDEKRGLVHIIKAKAGADELKYLRLLQSHKRLRGEIIRLGSKRAQAKE